MSHSVRLFALAFLTLLPVVAQSDEQLQACIDGDGQAGVSACQSLAGRLSADLPRLRQLGARLEENRRYAAAVAVYQVARRYYPSDRTSLQGLVRNRSAARQLEEAVVQPVERPGDSVNGSTCWVSVGEAALRDCREQLAEGLGGSRLRERIGDILRSQGKVEEALAAYREARSTEAGSTELQSKHDALLALAQDGGGEAAIPPSEAATTGVVAQLELLEDLRSRDLVNAQEYERRREQILDTALAGGPAVASAAVSGQPAHLEKVDQGAFGRYRALVIGNEKYRNQQRLRTPVNDVEAIGRLLQEDYGFEVTTLRNADRYAMAKALSDLRKDSRPDDNVLVYFAGHGYLDEVTRRGYWLPVDADADSYANWISTSDVTDTLAAISARHAIVIADSCFAGSLLRSVDGIADSIHKLKSKRSRTVITSGGLEPVADGARSFGNRKHSVFANALLNALRANDKPIEAGRLFLEVREVVSNNAEQTPQHAPIRNAGHEGGDFIFLPLSSVCDELRGDCRSPTP